MASFVLKGLLLSAGNWQYFLATLLTRGIASATIKAFVLSYVFRVKSLKLKKP